MRISLRPNSVAACSQHTVLCKASSRRTPASRCKRVTAILFRSCPARFLQSPLHTCVLAFLHSQIFQSLCASSHKACGLATNFFFLGPYAKIRNPQVDVPKTRDPRLATGVFFTTLKYSSPTYDTTSFERPGYYNILHGLPNPLYCHVQYIISIVGQYLPCALNLGSTAKTRLHPFDGHAIIAPNFFGTLQLFSPLASLCFPSKSTPLRLYPANICNGAALTDRKTVAIFKRVRFSNEPQVYPVFRF